MAAAALSGLPPLSGFFSKEAILAALAGLRQPRLAGSGAPGRLSNRLLRLPAGLHHSVSERRRAQEAQNHHRMGRREALYWAMAVPSSSWLVLTLVLGFLKDSASRVPSGAAAGRSSESHAWLSVHQRRALSGLGVGTPGGSSAGDAPPRSGFVEADPCAQGTLRPAVVPGPYLRSLVKAVIDEGFSKACANNEEKVIDDGIDGFCRFTLEPADLLSRLQSGMLRYNLAVMFGALALVALYFLLA